MMELMLLASAKTLYAQTVPSAGGTALLSSQLEDFLLDGQQKDLGTLEVVDVQGQSFSRALRITTAPGATNPWHVQAHQRTVAGIKQGDVLLARFWVRCVDSMTGEAFTTLVV